MQQNIIYQKEQITKTKSIIARICSCLSFLKLKQNQTKQEKYQLGIDSPKSSFLGQRKLIVLDLDETLVHSQFQLKNGYDFAIDIIVQRQIFTVYVTIRPGVQQFIEQLNQYYDIVFWTASLQEYADPVMDFIDPNHIAIGRLYRDSCTPLQIGFTKNLNKLGRDLKEIIIIDNSEVSYHLNPENEFQIKDFYFDKQDQELELNIPFFIWLSQLPDVRPVAQLFKQFNNTQSDVFKMKNTTNLGTQFQENDPKIIQSLSKSLSLQKARIMLCNQVFRTLTLSKEDDEDELDEIKIRDKLGLNQPTGQKGIQQQNQTDEDDQDTQAMAH
ncbi:unnamed protein product [Paramecium pentaurelia]|uniref:FCP1 homology domain-containing protein n=1 Tax=Paramecium pentaurelia TaxID=43138 RepID=A0A8S1WSJ2_9CILI|nr:unnamed protein product [Paramecium pentaurelia]